MRTLRAAAIDIDGVLLPDTFSPVIKKLVEAWGGSYDREVERHVFSQNRNRAARYLIDRLGTEHSEEQFLALYFETRAQWLADHPPASLDEVGPFLNRLSEAGLRLVCYGGLDRRHFEKELAPWTGLFETYVCTNDFRPGVAEIVRDVFGLPPQSVVFFDDVSRVGEAAKALGAPFIGLPAAWPWGHQRSDMVRLGVPLILNGLQEVTQAVLADCDTRAGQKYWRSA